VESRTGSLTFDDGHMARLIELIVALRPMETRQQREFGMLLYRLLSRGRPVTSAELARELGGDPGEVQRMAGEFACFTETSEAGEIVGFGGLSVVPTRHSFTLPDAALFTWCAWDALFIPEVLGRTARVTSPSPVTGREIRLTIAPGEITHAEPAGAALSMVLPPLQALRQDVRSSFCGQVHFFGSADEAREWAAARREAYVATLDQGMRLGRLKNAAQFGDLLPTTGP